MFDWFKKKPQPVQEEKMPIPLPELPNAQKSVVKSNNSML